MTDGFRCDGCGEWFVQEYRLLEIGFDPEATAHPSLSLDDIGPDAYEICPDGQGDFCPRCGRGTIEELVDLFDESGESNVPHYVREALPDSPHSGDMLVLEYEERFLDIEFEEVPCGECGEAVPHQIETDSYREEKTTECSNCHAVDAVDVDTILEGDSEESETDTSDDDESIEDSDVEERDELGTYEVKDYSTGPTVIFGTDVAGRIETDRASVRSTEDGVVLVPGQLEEWPDYAVRDEKGIQVSTPGVEVLDASPGDEITAIADGDVVHLEVEGRTRDAPPPDDDEEPPTESVDQSAEPDEDDDTKYGHLTGDDPISSDGDTSTHPGRICQNCGNQVSKQYAKVHAPDEDEGPRVCPECPDKVRDGGEVREARSTRRTGR